MILSAVEPANAEPTLAHTVNKSGAYFCRDAGRSSREENGVILGAESALTSMENYK
jgi:hypothetical protein